MTTLTCSGRKEPRSAGLRMTAEEYLQLEEDRFRYELIDGVICLSPSPTPRHQHVMLRIVTDIHAFLEANAVGYVLFGVDVPLRQGPNGGDLVYRPDIVFIRSEIPKPLPERIAAPPQLVVEIISETSRAYDSQTKMADYERVGILEYWLIDPLRGAMTFYRLEAGRYIEAAAQGDRFQSRAIPGFVLDLSRVRQTFAQP